MAIAADARTIASPVRAKDWEVKVVVVVVVFAVEVVVVVVDTVEVVVVFVDDWAVMRQLNE